MRPKQLYICKLKMSHLFTNDTNIIKNPLSIETYTLLDCGSDKTLYLIFEFISFQLSLDEEGFLTVQESKRDYFTKINTEY